MRPHAPPFRVAASATERARRLSRSLSLRARSSAVVEIVSAGDVVFALTLSGVCAAFRGERRLAFINSAPDEVVRSLFYNKLRDSLVTVSVFRDDNFSSLRCRDIPLEQIRRGRAEGGSAVFASESLKWPGFVEFDDVNRKVLTYSATDKAYKVRGPSTTAHARAGTTPCTRACASAHATRARSCAVARALVYARRSGASTTTSSSTRCPTTTCPRSRSRRA